MKKLQGNPWGKLLAVLLLLVTAFGAGHYALRSLLNLPYMAVDNWQETSQFYDLLWERQGQLAQLCSLDMQLAGELSFADQQQKLQTLSQLKDALQSDATWFRWQIFDASGQNVLYSNLDERGMSQSVEKIYYATFTAGENYVNFSPANQTGSAVYGEAVDEGMSKWYDSGEDLSGGVIPAAGEELIIQCGVPSQVDETVEDEFFELWKSWGENRANFQPNLIRTGVFALLSLGCFLYILWTAGHKEGEEGIVLTWQEHIFLDL